MNRESGSFLIEMMIALTVLTVGLLGFFSSFMSNVKASSSVKGRDDVRVALENTAELIRGANFSTAYATYNNASISVPGLYGSGGSTATVQITCYVNETAIPPEFGPVIDLDGVAGLTTANCSATYKLLPVQLSLTYATDYGTDTRNLYILLGGN
jgi:hypothetical protein